PRGRRGPDGGAHRRVRRGGDPLLRLHDRQLRRAGHGLGGGSPAGIRHHDAAAAHARVEPVSRREPAAPRRVLPSDPRGVPTDTADSSPASAPPPAPGPVPAPAPTATKVATVQGFLAPESVLHDSTQDIYFVSNINGSPMAKDNNGFISRVRPDGAVENLKFIEGGRNGVTLNAPKGLALEGDTLWVADIDAVRAFDAKTGAAIDTVSLSKLGAVFLSD